jgi:hypothetical protein
MKLHRLFPVLLVFVLAVPAHGREPIDPLLQAAGKALDHYQQLAPGIHCEDATTTEFRDVRNAVAPPPEAIAQNRALPGVIADQRLRVVFEVTANNRARHDIRPAHDLADEQAFI